MMNNEYREYDVLNIAHIPMEYMPVGLIRNNGSYESLKWVMKKISPYIWICDRRDHEMRNTLIVHPGQGNVKCSDAYRYINRRVNRQDELYLLRIEGTNKFELYDGRGEGRVAEFELIWKEGEVTGPGSITISKSGKLASIMLDKYGTPHIFDNVSTHKSHGLDGMNDVEADPYYTIYDLAPISVPQDYTTNGWYTAITKHKKGTKSKTVLFPMHDFEIRDDDGYIVDELVENAFDKYYG